VSSLRVDRYLGKEKILVEVMMELWFDVARLMNTLFDVDCFEAKVG
jgi:hypothetical protein